MNDVLKFFSRCLKPFGYQIKPRNGLDFLFIKNLDKGGFQDIACIPALAAKGQAFDLPGLDRLQIVFRTCVRVGRNVDTRERVSGAPLEENMLRCLNSLLGSVRFAAAQMPDLKVSLLILDDRSDEAVLEKIRALVASSGVGDVAIKTTETAGQGASLYEQFIAFRDADAQMVYFIEDDYLHEKDAIYRLCAFYRRMSAHLGSPLVLYPQEHPVMYSQHYPSYIVLGEDRHWRSIRHATHSFFTHTAVVKEHWKYFENTKYVGNRKKRRLGSEDKTTNRIFRHIPAFAPLRPVAVHLQFADTLPPFYDWRPAWEDNAAPEKTGTRTRKKTATAR